MRETTLCLPLRDNAILLGMKKRGFGQSRWNGMGGKPHDGESVTAAAVRELEEEIGIRAAETNLTSCATLDFFFDHKPEWNQRVYVFFVRAWQGEPCESEEMRPQWFPFTEIPYDAMWSDDIHWLPEVLKGKTIKGEFHFSDDGITISKFKITPVSHFGNSQIAKLNEN